jgi:DNA-directed RNA polymerase subunit RPC12/RpoP
MPDATMGAEAVSDRSALDLRDDLLDLALRYEEVIALDLTNASMDRLMRTAPGSRVPPGMQEILDDDEVQRAVTAIDDWAEFLAHVLADELDVAAPSTTTPARLRLAAHHSEHFATVDYSENGLLSLAVQDDLRDHLRAMRRISGRSVRRVRTGVRCHVGCGGQYVSPLGTSEDRHDSSIRCDRCGHEVLFVVWSAWPRARLQYVTVEHAAKMAGTTVSAIKMRASRQKWRRIGTGADVRYYVEDVRGDVDVSA